VFCTVSGRGDALQSLATPGATGHKLPFTPDQFAAMVENALGSR